MNYGSRSLKRKRHVPAESDALDNEEDVAALINEISDRARAVRSNARLVVTKEDKTQLTTELFAEYYKHLPYRLRVPIWKSVAFRQAKVILTAGALGSCNLSKIIEQLKLECGMFHIGSEDTILVFARTSKDLPTAFTIQQALSELEILRIDELKDYLDDHLIVKLLPTQDGKRLQTFDVSIG